MSKEDTIDIIKGALLLEKRGKIFYENTAKQTKSKSVRKFFENMAVEEEKHIQALAKHLVNLIKQGKYISFEYGEKPSEIDSTILNQQIKKDISAAGYEAAAISASIAMEDQAVRYYSEQAAKAQSPEVKQFFEWLANWEKAHLKYLSDIDKELRDSVWADNNFWPVI